MNKPLLYFAGHPVHLNDELMVTRTVEEIPRTWRERLFTWPWRPLRRTRTQVTEVPSRAVMFINDDALVMHSELWRDIQAAVKRNQEAAAELW